MSNTESPKDVLFALRDDVAETRKHKDAQGNVQFWRRSRIRTIFSVLEAWIYVSKQDVLKEAKPGTLSPGDMALLREEAYDVDKDGGVAINPKFIPVEKNLKFVYRVLASVRQSQFRLDTSEPGWASLKTALKARNRITHPRLPTDLEISDTEIDAAEIAFKWFMRTSLAAGSRGWKEPAA